jgi:hypothetical protein
MDVGSGFDQRTEDGRVAVFTSNHKWRQSIFGHGILCSVVLEQLADNMAVASEAGKMQSG